MLLHVKLLWCTYQLCYDMSFEAKFGVKGYPKILNFFVDLYATF